MESVSLCPKVIPLSGAHCTSLKKPCRSKFCDKMLSAAAPSRRQHIYYIDAAKYQKGLENVEIFNYRFVQEVDSLNSPLLKISNKKRFSKNDKEFSLFQINLRLRKIIVAYIDDLLYLQMIKNCRAVLKEKRGG